MGLHRMARVSEKEDKEDCKRLSRQAQPAPTAVARPVPRSAMACDLCELNRLHQIRKNLATHKEQLQKLLGEWHQALESVMDELPRLDFEYQEEVQAAAQETGSQARPDTGHQAVESVMEELSRLDLEVQEEAQAAAQGACRADTGRTQLDTIVSKQLELHNKEKELRLRIRRYTDVLHQMTSLEDENMQNIHRVESSIRLRYGSNGFD